MKPRVIFILVLAALAVIAVGLLACAPGRAPDGPSGGPTCQTYAGHGLPLAIPDAGSLTTPVLNIASASYIYSLTVSLTVSHSALQDLEGRLCDPRGCSAWLFREDLWGNGTAVLNFRDDGPDSFFGAAIPYGGTYRPYTPIGANGTNAGGQWALVIDDLYAGNTGTLDAWSITQCAGAPRPATNTPTRTPTPTPTLTPTPGWTATPFLVARTQEDADNGIMVADACVELTPIPWTSLPWEIEQPQNALATGVDVIMCNKDPLREALGSVSVSFEADNVYSNEARLYGLAGPTPLPHGDSVDCLTGDGEQLWYKHELATITLTDIHLVNFIPALPEFSTNELAWTYANWTASGDNAACQGNYDRVIINSASWSERIYPTPTPVPTATPLPCPATPAPKPWWWIW